MLRRARAVALVGRRSRAPAAGWIGVILIATTLLCPTRARAGLDWPADQLLPAFSSPAPVLDCIDVTSVGGAQSDLFTSLEGIVNRTQPRIACVVDEQEGGFTWLNLHNLPYALINGYSAILKYRTNVNGLVVTDPAQPHTLNLATTIAGVNDELICDPSLLATLTNAPYNLAIHHDLRGMFSDKYQVYRYLYTNYWPQCTHRVMAGMDPNVHGNFRDYLVAVKSAVVWLDPAISKPTDRSVLSQFLSGMTPAHGVYAGWWPSEANGLNWIYQYGIPVLASDFMDNASVFSGVRHAIHVPDIPPPPPLQNKVYVALILSDGDNIQYMQHAMKLRWGDSARGSVPIGWTVSPLAADMDPGMLNFYWSTATRNDCLISGPSGAGYTHMQKWSSANLTAFAKVSDPYLQRSGLRVITIWDQVTTGVARAFATNCPTLLGLTDQSGGAYTSVNLGLCTIGLSPAYSSSTSDILNGIVNAASGWDGSAPLFVAAQANVWNVTPSGLKAVADALDPNKYVVVRPDQLFLLHNRVAGRSLAMTKAAGRMTPTSATLEGFVVPNAADATAWLEWGTNTSYGSKTPTTHVAGTSVVLVKASVAGLSARTIYHYRVAASNALGVAYGADEQFTLEGRLKTWGQGSAGQTNPPAGLTNVVGIAGGDSHGLAVRNDGSVAAWGLDDLGQTNVPAGLTDVVEVAGGIGHSLALKANGTVVAWGGNGSGQTNVPAGLTNVVAIAAGGYHNLALQANGRVTAWGDNGFGQTNVPADLSNVVAVAAGLGHSVALEADGSVRAWGYNNAGQRQVPANLDQVTAVSAGQNNSLALKADTASAVPQPASRWVADALSGSDGSTVAAWTDVLGGKIASQGTPTKRPRLYSNVLNGHKVLRFASASSQYLTVASADSPMSAAGSFSLVVVFRTSTPGNFSSSFYHNTGLLGCEQPNVVPDWALCISGSQLGLGLGAGGSGCGPDLSLYGGTVIDNRAHIAMYVRAGETVTLYVDGVVVATQSSLCTAPRGNYDFQIGAMTASSYFFNGDMAEIQLYDRALNSPEISNVDAVLAATYGVTTGVARRLLVWGNNSYGQTSVPTDLTNVVEAVSGGPFNLTLSADNLVTGWGQNNAGQTNVPAGLTNIAAIACGGAFGLAIADQTPRADDTTVSGYVNHDLIVTLPGVDPDGDPLGFRIVMLPTTGTLFQYAGGSRGTAIDSPDLLISDPGGRVIFAPATDETGTPYATFSFVAQDAYYSSDPATVTLNVNLPAEPQIISSSWNPESSGVAGFRLGSTGSSNATYSVWASTNLVDWTKLGTATETIPGQYYFLDTAATNWPQRFYRTGAP